MLNWIITFFLMSVIAGVLGFWGLAGTFASVAQFFTGLFVLLFLMSLLYSLVTGRRVDPPPL